MRLLGTYPSQLASFYYQALQELLASDISQGGYAGGALFDSAAAQALLSAANSFSAIPTWSAGQVASSYDVDQMFGLLQAQFSSLISEIKNAASLRSRLLDILASSTSLVNSLRIEAGIDGNRSSRLILPSTQELYWPLAAGYRWVSTVLPATDPLTSISSSGIPPVTTVIPASGGSIISTPWVSSSTFPHDSYAATAAIPDSSGVFSGVGISGISQAYPLKSIAWSIDDQTTNEQLGGTDWSRLSLLYPQPQISYSSPQITQIFPSGSSANYLTVSGSTSAGMVPTYVQLTFSPRYRTTTVVAANPTVISPYLVQATDVVIWDSTQVYTLNLDYFVVSSDLTFATGMLGKTLNVAFYEAFPGYQCSTNSQNWSPLIWLDPTHPNPDGSFPNLLPIKAVNGGLPVTNEQGVPTGVYIALQGIPQSEATYLITVPALPSAGIDTTMTLELERPAVINSLQISPLSAFPMEIIGLIAEGMTSDVLTTVISDSSSMLTEPVALHFTPTLTRKLHLQLRQRSYSLKQYQITPPDAQSRQALLSVASLLPPAAGGIPFPEPQLASGAVYAFGIQNIVVSQVQSNALETFVVGPLNITGTPDVVYAAANVYGYADLYLLYNSYDSANSIVSSGSHPLVSGSSWAFPSNQAGASTSFFLKIVLRGELSICVSADIQATAV